MKKTTGFLTLCLLALIISSFSRNEERHSALLGLIQRAESGDGKALYDLGHLHDIGYDTIPIDSALSTDLYRRSALKGYAPAMNILGFRFFNGEFVERNIDSALYWINQAADAGDIKAAGNLGYLYSQSEEIPHDYLKAEKWLRMASDAGLPTAQSSLADLYRTGPSIILPDTLMAISLYEKAFSKGLADAELKLLSMMGYKWKLLPPDSAMNLALHYYELGAREIATDLVENVVESSDNPRALALLGDAYSRGEGVPYNHELSVEYFLHSALLGNPSAQFVIAELLEFFPDALENDTLKEKIKEWNVELIPQEDITDARLWYEKASKGGVNNAEEASYYLFSRLNLHN